MCLKLTENFCSLTGMVLNEDKTIAFGTPPGFASASRFATRGTRMGRVFNGVQAPNNSTITLRDKDDPHKIRDILREERDRGIEKGIDTIQTNKTWRLLGQVAPGCLPTKKSTLWRD